MHEPLLDLNNPVCLPLIVLPNRNRLVVLVGRQLDGDVLGDEGIGIRMDRTVEEPRVELGLRLGLRGERDQLYPLDIDRAFNKLDQIKSHVKVWWREGTQSQQLIRDGEVDMMSIWNARASELKQQGVPVEIVWNGAVRSTSTWSVLKGAPNRKLAWELIAFASQAKPQAEFNTRLFYGPIHPDAYTFIPKDIAVQLPTYEDNQAISVREDDQWEADRIVQIEQRFMQWLAS